jgi:diaminohydroxyphosphoribosylaminopyrimidine deaminase / 5-amino-6-(5-phosphoribosylamino)uracil reductase
LDRYSDIDLNFTRRALDLAAEGMGLVSPNPLVGCVIVSQAGEVVGEGSYTYDGVVHAEMLALQAAGTRSQGATAYVSLEPHAHKNRTEPCTAALINAGIKRVVCPIEDPNPKVSGRGFEELKSAGLEVCVGPFAKEAAQLNERFICWHQKGRPFVHLKLAMSLDGRISVDNSVSTALSGEQARECVQQIRHEHDAILVGGNTAFVDDPSLTDRSGEKRRRPLVRVILDNRLRMSVDSVLASTARGIPTMVFTNSPDRSKADRLGDKGIEVIHSPMGGRDLSGVLQELKKREIQSLLVEGGTEVAGSFCDERLVDKFSFIMAPLIIGGREAPAAIGGAGAANLSEAIKLKDIETHHWDRDVELTAYPA